MADYWKSQPRHFCEICKCWMAANKVSITMHEQGGRHKESVEKKIRETSKRQAAESAREQDVKHMLEEMNRGALNGMIKDLTEDPSVVQRYGQRVESTVRGKDVSGLLKQQEARDNPHPLPEGWEKLHTEEGRPYYWHSASQHTQWERPLTAAESAGQMQVVEAEAERMEEKDRVARAISEKLEELQERKKEEEKDEPKEEKEEEEEEEASAVPLGPELAPSPYGRWEVVKVRPVTKTEPPEEKEEEKKEEVEVKTEIGLDFARPFKAFSFGKRPAGGGGPVAFKKRKAISNRSLRTRDEED